MTAGPPVTVVDPHGAALPAPIPAPASRWTRGERSLALTIAVLLAVATAAASNISSRPPSPFVRSVDSEVTLGNPGSLQLSAVLDGSFPPVDDAGSITADNGWTLAMAPEHLARGTALVFVHDSTCDGLAPPTQVRIGSGSRVLDLPVRGHRALSCDPAEPLRVVSSSLTAGDSTTIEIRLVNASVDTARVAGFRLDGFDLRPVDPLPTVLPGRSRDRPLRLDDLTVHSLRLVADVGDCATARRTLDEAVRGERPDALPARVDDAARVLTVKGLEAYLDLLLRKTCVR